MMALEFDFEARTERQLPASATRVGDRGKYIWYDLDAAADPGAAEVVLRGLGLDDATVSKALDPALDETTTYVTHAGGLFLRMTSPKPDAEPTATVHVGLLLGDGYCATVRRGEVSFLSDVWRTCPEDFRQFAQTPGFLLYEFWDHLIGSYRVAAGVVGDRVLRTQDDAFHAGDDIFGSVAALSRDLLSLRRAMVAARETLSELATRRSPVVPASTTPYLQTLVASLDRLVADLAVEREILAETLNLYIGLVGHRTNQVVNRLTVISFVFLPLTFLCGVYGMNFRYLPELEWRYGYHVFWALAAVIVSSSLYYMKRRGWW
jgi:magnesium transporter